MVVAGFFSYIAGKPVKSFMPAALRVNVHAVINIYAHIAGLTKFCSQVFEDVDAASYHGTVNFQHWRTPERHHFKVIQ